MDPDKPKTDDEQTDRQADRETDRQTDENENSLTTDADKDVDKGEGKDKDSDTDKDSDSEDEETAAQQRIANNTLFTSSSLPFLLPSDSSSSIGTVSEWSQDDEAYQWRDQE